MEALLGIAILVIMAWMIRKAVRARRKRKTSRHSAQHSLHSRIDVDPARSSKIRNKRFSVYAAPPPLPHRSTHSRNRVVVLGPRGITPVQFPCCPVDKERNEQGKPQKIFWDASAQCYYCSRGHRIQRNGKIIVP